jgi:hypothetical protein
MNLVELVTNQLGGDTLSKIGGLLGTPPDQTRTAVSAAVPTLLAGLSQLAGSGGDGARRVAAAVESADESIVGNVSQALSTGGRSMIESGGSMLTSLFGNNMLAGLGNALGRFTGLGSGAITSLLGFLAPTILGILKGRKREMGLDAGGLSNLLVGQQKNIASAIPSGLGNLLGSVPGLSTLSGLSSAAGRAGEAVYDAGRAAVGAGASAARSATTGATTALRWALPLLGLVILGLILWAVLGRSAKPDVEPTARNVRDVAVDARDATLASVNLAGAEQIATLKDQTTAFFKSTTDAFNGITDAASAEAALPKLRELSTKLDTMKTAVGALPADAKTTVNSLFETSLASLKPIITKVLAIPGVSEKIKPVVDELLSKINGLAGTT